MMNLSETEQEILSSLKDYANKKGFALNSDEETLAKVVKGLAMLKDKKGEFYCPCRLTTGNKDIDKNIICPCIYHEKEIAEQGSCHCKLFFAK